jgi:hypothetical protein
MFIIVYRKTTDFLCIDIVSCYFGESTYHTKSFLVRFLVLSTVSHHLQIGIIRFATFLFVSLLFLSHCLTALAKNLITMLNKSHS